MDPRTERMLAERQAAQDALAAMPRAQRLRMRATTLVSRHRRPLIAVGAGVFVLVLGYVTLVTLPARANDRRLAELRESSRLQAEERISRGEKLDVCLADAQALYVANWDASCKAMRRGQDCRLPSDEAQVHESRLLQMREDCFKRH
jgi:hypothetical protein